MTAIELLQSKGIPPSRRITVRDLELDVIVTGDGPPVLLLHGYPQTKYMWRHLIPALSQRFTVVAPDLRGYGDSAKPRGGPDHAEYAKRTMALDFAALMTELGFRKFALVGHDRGARVSYRMALDHPDRVERLALLDIMPTLTVFDTVNQEVATAYYHWFFLAQPKGFPEHLIGADPGFYLRHTLQSWSIEQSIVDETTFAEYLRCFSEPDCIAATCEDYRAGATIDLAHDRADWGTRITAPMLVLWGLDGLLGRHYDPLSVWWSRAVDVRGEALPCGHFLAEERPAETLKHIWQFLTDEPLPTGLNVPEGPAP